MEKVVTKRSLRDFRQRENPWKDRSPLIGKDDLIRNKAASGRPKDRIDVEELGKLP